MRIFRCSACSKIYIETDNIQIYFPTAERLNRFADYLESIDADYYATLNHNKGLKKDIYLPVGDTAVSMAFSISEFAELKQIIRNYLVAEQSIKSDKTVIYYKLGAVN